MGYFPHHPSPWNPWNPDDPEKSHPLVVHFPSLGMNQAGFSTIKSHEFLMSAAFPRDSP